ncbi:radical SAM protein [Candidatus Parcubacteria bacterium]|nr:radical SAM protein [Candidatus Parcubacteria bacterium]
MDFFNPIKKAEVIREKLRKDGKYLISKIEGSKQEGGTRKVLDAYFRYKDYMDSEEWFHASEKEIWSPKFLGLVENLWSKPIQEVKELEFQNPSYSAGFRLSGDPRKFSKVFTIQLAGCDYDCNYCYVPKELNVANPKLGKYFSAEEIINHFLLAKENSKEPMNVIRISGGNPTIVPEIIIDIYNEIKKRQLSVYLWIDSNLSTPKYLEDLGSEIKNILKQKNVGVVGCFKGADEKDFAIITGAESEYYEKQFETAEWFLDCGTDFYVYLPALIYGNNVEEKLKAFIERLGKLNKNLPLRIEVLEIIDFPWAKLNMDRAEKLGRPLPKTDQRIVFNLWYNKLLPQFYTQEELDKYCCQVSLE